VIRVVILALALAACSSSKPGGAPRDASSSRDGLSCAAEGSCAGPMCGTTCCQDGEACISGTCMCGSEPACTGGNHCAAAVLGQDRCGSICCGATSVCPGVQ